VKLLADENFDNDILRGLVRRDPAFDVIRVQDLPEIAGQDDPTVLFWATSINRILLTHDLSTMIPALHEYLRDAVGCTPIVMVPDSLPISIAIEEILLLDQFAIDSDWIAGVIYLPIP